MGRVNSDASTDVAGGTFTVTKGATGQWYLSIPGMTNTTGVLIISNEGGATNNIDNTISYQWDSANTRWVIESRDTPASGLPTLEDGATGAEDMFSFAYFENPIFPTVAITSPANSAALVAPATFSVDATAADANGTVTQVEFLLNGTVVSTDPTSPFSLAQSGLTPGVYAYTARATDNDGNVTTSAAVTISVVTDPTKTALYFDGVNDYVTMGAAPTLNVGGSPGNGLTLECWFRKEGAGVTSTSGSGGIVGVPLFGKGRGESDGSNVDCNIFFGITTAGILVADFETYPATGLTAGQNYPITATNTAIVNNQWYHAAVTYDNATNTWKMYLDGVQVGSATAAVGALPRWDSIQHFGIGAAFTSTGVPEGAFAGRIDEPRVWNYARSAADIAASRNYEIATAPGLIGRYGLNEGTGSTAANSAGVAGAPVGTLTNGTLWIDGPTFAVNTPPTVSLTAPADGTTVMTGAIIALTADATDTDGISKVEFYEGANLLGQDTTAPYAFNWTPSVAGDFNITAKAYDALNNTTTSTAIVVHVVVNTPPTAAISAPLDNANFTAPATINIAATATDTDGTVAKVEFYNGATKLGEDTTDPYAFSWNSVPQGDYTLTVKSIDNLGATTTSAAITVHVMPPTTTPPTVSITAPLNNASFVTPATINITADAADTDGTVAKVEFFNGATKLGEDLSAPFSYSWTGVAIGDYTLTAKATDDMTATTTSGAIDVHVVANSAPVVTITAPANNATGIGSSTSLDLGINDVDGDAQTVNYFGRVAAPAVPGPDFTFVAIPDTQYYSENTGRNASTTGNPAIDTGAKAAIYNSQMNWIVNNRTARNIAFVSHMGDIAQNGDAFESEWIVASTAQSLIENPATTLVAHGIPWGCAPGNHDQMPVADAGGVTNFYTKYFNFTRWDNRPYYGGHFGTKPIVSGGAQFPANTNNYQLFSASGMDFIVIHMEYDARAKSFYQGVLDWADALLKAYPTRRAIITSHWIVNTGNPATFSTQGQNIYDDLKDNPNLFLMLCGHVHGEGRRSDVYQGRTVYSILSDYQETKNGGNGFLRALTFKPSTNTIRVESYSPWVNRAVDATDAIPSWTTSYDLTYNMQTPVTDWIPLGSTNVAAAGTTASLSWTGLEAGKDYEWYATVNDSVNTVTTATRRFSTTPNAAPTVAITAPVDGAGVGLNTTINLTATATDTDGSIARVEFFDGGTKLGEDTTAPFEYAWTGATPGNHALTAVATDNAGLDAISAIVTISVNNIGPTVTLTEPDELESFYDAPTNLFLSANASDADGTIAKVEFYANTTKIGEALAAPYEFTWTSGITGDYTMTAKAIDNLGASTVSNSALVHVTNIDNVAPSVAITAPAAGVAFVGNITITASAADTDGTVTKVEFFSGATKLGEDTTAPYSFVWNSVAVGNYTLTAVATDNDAGTTTSVSVGLNVQTAPLAFSENFDSMGTAGTTPPAGWSIKNGEATTSTNATWTDSIPIVANAATGSVKSMVAAAGALTVNNAPTANQNNGYNAQGASSTDRVIATAPTSVSGMAIQWQVTNTSANIVTALRIGYDTRRYLAVATANELPGYQLFYSLDSGTTWTNVAALNPTISGSGVQVPNTVGVTTVSPTDFTLSSGWAVGAPLQLRWVDDNAVATSPDQIIGLDNVTLTAAAAQVGAAPTVAVTAPTTGSVFFVGDTINLAATAADTDGTITKVEFYNGATKLGEDNSDPYAYAWTGFAAGTYSLTARATDNDNNVVTSSAISVTVNAAPGSGTLTRGPYLNSNTSNSIVVRWRSSQSITGRVMYGTSLGSLTSVANEASAQTDHVVTLTGLQPHTRYYYSIGSAFDTLAGNDANYTFRTSPTSGTATDTRIWVVGDCGRGTQFQMDVRDAYYAWTGARTPDMCLMLGDNAYNSGTDSEYTTGFYNIYPTMFRKMPLWSCLGNHDANNGVTTPTTNFPYFDMFTFPTAGECGGVASGTEHYFSWDYGNIHFISLDSQTTLANSSPTAPQSVWLQNDLASTTKTWIIAFFHHPPYSKGSHNSDTEAQMVTMRQVYNPILEAGGCDMVLVGHSHAYERSMLIDGHYGVSTTLTNAMKKNAGSGRTSGTGAYIKPLTGPRDHFGTVYTVTGSAGSADGGTLNHPVMYVSYNTGGTFNIDINGNTLNATYIEKGATNGTFTASDNFTMVKQGAADTDGDGVADEFEIANGMNRFSNTDATGDSDGDGNDARAEYLFGLNPGTSDRYNWTTTPNPTTGNIDVTFPTLPQRTYQVFWSNDLLTWNPASVVVNGDGTSKVWTDDGTATGTAPALEAHRFYRVQVANGP